MDTVSPVNYFPKDDGKKKKKKVNKSFVIVKAAMSLFRPKTTEDKKRNVCKPPPSPSNHDVLINQILGTVRPLHVSDKLFPASPIRIQRHKSTDSFDSFGESSTVYGSSASLEDLESLHVDRLQVSGVREGDYRRGHRKINSSPFASAMDLLELGSDGESDDEDDCHAGEEEEEEEDIGNDNGGDEMIDTKADEFITQFYSKMRVQG